MKKISLYIFLLFTVSVMSQEYLMQNGSISTCSGTFYDSGGSAGNYGNNETFSFTICPESLGQQIQLDFTQWNTQINADVMTIYNGTDNTFDEIGTFSGGPSANPGIIIASLTEINPGGLPNPDGCLTIEWTSNASANTDGWAATISCFEPCQDIEAIIDSTVPTVDAEGVVRVCQGEEITFNGDGIFSVSGADAIYDWDFDDGSTDTGQTVNHTFNDAGIYLVKLVVTDTNPQGCFSGNFEGVFVHVSTDPDFSNTQATNPTICFGETTTMVGDVSAEVFSVDCANGGELANLGSLGGLTYTSTLDLDCFEGQTINNVDQIVSICIIMEHTWIGDLEIIVISPSGQQVTLHNQTGSGLFLGDPLIADGTGPGVGWEYCFTMSAASLLSNGPTVQSGTPTPSATIQPGDYLPVGDFSSFIGSTLNGEWSLFIEDHLNIDDGTIFSWSLNFDESLIASDYTFTPIIDTEVWDADATITNITGNTITVEPPTAGQHCYTYRVVDDFGCEYTHEVCVDVLPEIITDAPNNMFLCNPGAPPYNFDLTQNDGVITAVSPNPGDLVISYYETQADADSGTGSIGTPGNYNSSSVLGTPQDIFVRIEYLTSDCYESSSFTLNITPEPTINPVADMELCDDASNDGVEAFDLESQSATILGAQSGTDFTVTYYNNLTDANSGTGALSSPYNGTDGEAIYVRVELNGDASCNNVSVTPLFSLIVNPRDDASFTLTPTCDGGTASISGATGGIFTFNPIPTDGASLDPVTGLVTGGTSGINYSIEYTTSGICPETETQDVTVITVDDPSFTTTSTCDGGTVTVTGTPGGTFTFNPVPTDSAIIDSSSGLVTGGTSGATYTIEYSTTGICIDSSVQNLTVLNSEDPTFSVLENCSGGTMIITGDSGGTFAFNPVPTDGATIDANSGTVDNGLFGTTYTVQYTTGGPCPETSFQNVTVLDEDDPSFSIAPTCDGGTAVINGTLGGTFAFNPVPTDGATIDVSTGEVFGISGASYSVEYTTSGVCSASSSISFNVLSPDDSSFTMEPSCDGGIATITGDSGGVFILNPIPTDGAVIDSSTGVITNGIPGASYSIDYTTNGICPTTTSQILTVHTLPILVVPTSLEVCDDGIPDGITSIDLSIKNTEISGGDTNIQVTYFLNQMDADSGMNPLPIPYTNTSNGQIVYVRGEDITTGCYDTTTLELVVEQAPIAFTPSPLEFCDPDNDGFGNFMLTDSELEITGGAAGLTVSYHETPTDAENNVLAQSSPYPNIVAYNQTIYVRVESSTIATDCATFVELQLVVNDTPDITDPPLPLEVCDNDTDGFAQFNLTSKNDEILNGLDSIQYQVSYYFNDVDAEAPMNAIGTLGAFINTEPHQQTLWVRVDDTVTGCYSITTLELIVNALPVLVQPSPINLCDYDTPGDEVEAFTLEDSIGEILNGQTGIIITFHESQLGADTNTDQIFSPYVNVIANAQTVFVRAENSVTGCVSTITLDLRVEPLPSPVTPTPLEVCDTDNDGFMTFNLESKTPEILNAQLDVTITYHETMDDANNNDNPLTSPYDNIQEDTQTVYARAEDDATGCYRVVELQLVVFPSPEVPLTIEDLVVCDDDTDGIALFDLTQMDAIIYGVQDPTQFILTYHVNQAGADTGNNPIVNVASYINSGSTIYVRLESIANGCVTTGSFNLVVALPPVPVFPTALDICDDDYYDDWDGISTFDLTVKDIEITGGNASWTVEYYETDAAAQAGTPVINPADAYQNTVNPKTLHVRVTDGDTGCYAFTTLLIRVNPNPTPQVPLPIELCDDTNTGDGQEIFDLEGEREDDIIGGESNVTASYYETLEDAESGVNAIADPMAYTSGSQTIYVRVTNTGDPLDPTDNGTGCYTIVELELIVHPLPEVVPVTGMIECVVGSTGYTEFDLESKTDEVLSGQDPSIFVVTYHELDTDAQSGMNALVSPYTNTVQFIQPIYVNITNTITGCNIATVSFNIEVQEGAEATAPAHDYIICDNIGDNDGFGQFNLSATPNGDPYDYDGDLHADILDGQDPMDYGVSFYLTQAEAEAGEVADMLPLVYENIENPQTIHVRVDNNATTCYALTTLTLQVDPLPIFDIEESYILCVDSVGGVVTTVFPPVIETYLDPTIYSFEWTESGDPLTILGTDSSFVPQQAGTYTVTVTNIATTCIETDTTEVIQSTPPDVTAQASTLAFADTHIIIATATGDGEYEFSLDGEPWVSEDPNTGSYTFVDVRPGEHTVVARDINECGESSDTVLIIDYPKFFTPNGDSHNPTWNIIGIYSIPNAKIYIFDRYGKLIKQLSPTGVGWDGTYNGELLPADDYWFTVEYNEPSNVTRKEFRAHFTLKR